MGKFDAEERTPCLRFQLVVMTALVGLFAGQAFGQDCNNNGLDDACDVTCGTPGGQCDLSGCGQSNDCNGNVRPDECDLVAPMFFGLGYLPGQIPGPDSSSRADGVSADGTVVVGTSGGQAFRWTRSTGMVGLGYLPESDRSEANSVSADGSVVVGRSLFFGYWSTAAGVFRWTASTGMDFLGHLPGRNLSTPPTVSADGSIVVGGDCSTFSVCATCTAFRWTSVEGIVGMGHLPGGTSESAATGISGDGAVVVGYSDIPDDFGCENIECGGLTDPFRWTAGDGMIGLGFPNCRGVHADDVSADGSVIVGTTDYDWGKAFRWTTDGEFVDLGDLPGGSSFATGANGVSGDGALVVGFSESASGREAFIWDATNGMRSLRAVLVDQYGLDLTGWTLTSARDISADGRSIVGYGSNPDGFTEAWIATLPSADTDANGIPDECGVFHPIPTASNWGLVILTLLLLIAAKLPIGRPCAA